MITKTNRRRPLILIGLMLSLLIFALDTTIVSTAMNSIVNSIGGREFYSLPFTAYMLFATLATLVCGGIADVYGHRPVFITGISLFCVSSICCGLSGTMPQLIVFRSLQGIGGGFIGSSVFTAVADLYPPQERGKYMGIITSMYGLASVVGPMAGGVISDLLGWKWIFFINIPIGLAALFIIIAALPMFRTAEARIFDVLGAVIISFVIVPVLSIFSFAGNYFDWISIQTLLLLLISIIALFFFIKSEQKSTNPIIPPALLKNGMVRYSFFISFLAQFIMLASIIYLPYFVQGVIGVTATTSGVITIPMMIALLIASNITGVLYSKSGKSKKMLLAAFLLMGLGAFGLTLLSVSTTYLFVILCMVVLGFGIGITLPLSNINAQLSCPPQQIGIVTSLVLFFRNTGGTIGSAICGGFMQFQLSRELDTLDFSALPEKLSDLLKNPNVLTNAPVMKDIQNSLPQSIVNDFIAGYHTAKAILSDSIGLIFAVCTGIAVIGFLMTLIWHEKKNAGSAK